MKNLFYLTVINFLLLSNSVNASLITETWYADVQSKTSSASNFTIGQTLSWSVTFDDESTFMNLYNDSDNSIYKRTCLHISTAPNCDNYISWYTFLSDSTFDFGSIFDDLKSGVAGATDFDLYDIYNSRTYLSTWTYPGSYNMTYQNDFFEFYTRDYILEEDSSQDHGKFTYNYSTNVDGVMKRSTASFYLENFRHHTSIPEPSAIALMGLGLLGFGVSRRKIKK